MTTPELTTIIGAIAALLGAPGFLAYINRRRAPSVASVAKMFKDERDRLQQRLDTMNDEHDRKIADLKAASAAALAEAEATWRQQHEEDLAQIKQLRDEVDSLYRRLYQSPPAR